MLSKDLELTLNEAFKNAREKRHEFMTVEHLLLALLDNDAALQVLGACGTELSELREELTEFVDSTTPLIPATDDERGRGRALSPDTGRSEAPSTAAWVGGRWRGS